MSNNKLGEALVFFATFYEEGLSVVPDPTPTITIVNALDDFAVVVDAQGMTWVPTVKGFYYTYTPEAVGEYIGLASTSDITVSPRDVYCIRYVGQGCESDYIERLDAIEDDTNQTLIRIYQITAIEVPSTTPIPEENYPLVCGAWYSIPFTLVGADPTGDYRYTIRNKQTDVLYLTQQLTPVEVPLGVSVAITFNAPSTAGTYVYDIECQVGGRVLPTVIRGQFLVTQDVTRV